MNAAVEAQSGELAELLTKPAPQPSMRLLRHGLHPGVPADRYYQRELGVASKSALDKVLESPATYRAWVDGLVDDEETAALRLGSALHMAALEPDRFALEYAAQPDFGDCRKKENKSVRDAWIAKCGDRELLSADEMRSIDGMVDALRTHPITSGVIARARAVDRELTVRWVDRETGVECKGRADVWAPWMRTIVDVKSAADASPAGFAKSVANYGYHRQAAMYLDGFRAAGIEADAFAFFVVEKLPPYLVAVYVLDDAAMAVGRRQTRRALTSLAECLKSGQWPGLPERIQTIELPRWAAE